MEVCVLVSITWPLAHFLDYISCFFHILPSLLHQRYLTICVWSENVTEHLRGNDVIERWLKNRHTFLSVCPKIEQLRVQRCKNTKFTSTICSLYMSASGLGTQHALHTHAWNRLNSRGSHVRNRECSLPNSDLWGEQMEFDLSGFDVCKFHLE